MKAKIIITILLYFLCQFPIHSNTIFSIHQDEAVFVGNNEDGYNPYARYKILPGTGEHYGRIIFSFDNNWGIGGMNEKGLVFDWMGHSEDTFWKKDSSKKDYVGNLSEKIIAECATVEEALKYYETYNEPLFKTSLIVFADTSGMTAFVFWEKNKLTIQRCKGRCVVGFGGNKVAEKYGEIEGSMNKQQMIELLNLAQQKGTTPTLYSNLYDLKKGMVHLFYFHNFEEEIVLDLHVELQKGKQNVELKDIFKTPMPEEEFDRLNRMYLEKEVTSIPLQGWGVLAFIGLIVLVVLYLIYYFISKK